MKFLDQILHIRPGFGGFDFTYEKSDVVFLGVPMDMTSSYRSGYRFAPAKIREASANLETYVPSVGVDVFETLNITDLGDLILVPTDMEESGRRIADVVKEISKDGKLPFLLGGEHTLSYFSAKALGSGFVVHLDAHRDLRDDYMGNKVCHATVMRRILDFLPPDRLVQIGVRSWSKEEAEFLDKNSITSFSPSDVMDDPIKVARDVEELAMDRKVYITIDLDIVDPAFAPGVATPEPGGPSTFQVMQLLKGLGGLNLAGCDVVELVPPHDDGTTAFVAARLIYELLGAISKESL
ncbi:MAG: agmatinase [Candidatus Hadarchaeota archaeon]